MGFFRGDRAKSISQSAVEQKVAHGNGKATAALYPGALSNTTITEGTVNGIVQTRNDTLFRVQVSPYREDLLNAYDLVPASGLQSVGAHVKLANSSHR